MTCQASLLTIKARTAEGAPSWHLIRNNQTRESQRDVKSIPDQGKNSRRKRKMWNNCLALLFTGDHSVRKSGDLPSEGHWKSGGHAVQLLSYHLTVLWVALTFIAVVECTEKLQSLIWAVYQQITRFQSKLVAGLITLIRIFYIIFSFNKFHLK